MVDYLIVGSGIAGICFAETALQHNKTITVFENSSQNSSTIAAGIYNPVILKRYSEVWNAKQQLDFNIPFYNAVQNRIGAQIDFTLPVVRKLFSTEEQNNWFVAADKPNLSHFLSPSIFKHEYKGISASFGYGEVLHTGFVDTKLLLQKYHQYLHQENLLLSETFVYSALEINQNYIIYKNIKAKHIIFAEGFGLHSNPYFNYLPLDGTKGEIIIINAPNLDLNVILNSSIYIVPLGNHIFKVGATYNWSDKTNQTTKQGFEELIEKTTELLNCNFTVIEHLAGIRPTVKDRRPLVGTHLSHPNMHILNGLGTRGIMLGPSLANDLYLSIESNVPLNDYINIIRFENLI